MVTALILDLTYLCISVLWAIASDLVGTGSEIVTQRGARSDTLVLVSGHQAWPRLTLALTFAL